MISATEEPTMAAIRVLIVDDEAFVRQILKRILAPYEDICVVGEAGTDDELSQMSKDSNPTW